MDSREEELIKLRQILKKKGKVEIDMSDINAYFNKKISELIQEKKGKLNEKIQQDHTSMEKEV